MNKNTYNLFVLVFMLSIQMFSQKITLNGVVKDSLNNPLELANVIAVNVEKNTIESYAITNEFGKYQLALTKGQHYLLRVSYLGYRDVETPIFMDKNTKNLTKNIILYEDKNRLAEVELVYEMPVTIKGDTIIYKTEAFTNGKEKKLKDVLKKLPGIEVATDGSVKVQGKKVSKLMVEGKTFFDGDPKLATKNLPAKAIDKVEVLRDYNEIQQTKGLKNDENIALNIKLKEGKKNLLFGDIEGGLGIEKKYVIHPNIFYYSPKTTLNFIGGINNIGEQAFTLNDYFRFNGGLKSLMRKGGSSLNLSSDELGFSFLKDNKAKDFNSKLVALNINHSFSKKFQFQGFIIASANKIVLETKATHKYNTNTIEQFETTKSFTNQNNTSGLVKLSSTYEPNSKLYLNYETILKKGSIKENNHTFSIYEGVENTIATNRTKDPITIHHNFEAYYTLTPKHIFSLEAQYLNKDQSPNLNLNTRQQLFKDILPFIDEHAAFSIFQLKEIKTHKAESVFNYYAILNKKSHFNLTIGNTFLKQKLNSSIVQTLLNNTQKTITDGTFANHTSYQFSDFYTGIHYKLKAGKFIFNPGLNLHFFSLEDNQLEHIYSNSITKLLPNFFTKFNIKKAESLTFRYGLHVDFTGVDKRAKGTTITNYNSLFRGNRNLTHTLYHQYAVQYFNFNMFSFTTITAMLQYAKKFDDIKSNITYLGNETIIDPLNIANPDDYFTMKGSFEKRIRSFKLNVETQLGITAINNQINGDLSRTESITQDYIITLTSNLKTAFNFEVGYSKKINNYTTNINKTIFLTDSPFANIELIFLKNFTLVADYEYNYYRNQAKSTRSNYSFLNASLFYQKKGSKFEFKISGNNLLNTTSLHQDYFSDYIISTSQYTVQPRFFTVGLKYDI